MGQRHKHADVIIAWANGAEIEYRLDPYENWSRAACPSWYAGWEYRVTPLAKKYRVALFNDNRNSYTSTADTPEDADFYEKTTGFVRWLTDWVEYEE